MPETHIGEHDYRYSSMDPFAAGEIGFELIAMLGGGVTALTEETASADRQALLMLFGMAQKIEPQRSMTVVKRLCEAAQIKLNGAWEPVVFSHHFQGRLLDSLMLARYVATIEFKDFFDGGLAKVMGSAPAPTPESRPSPLRPNASRAG